MAVTKKSQRALRGKPGAGKMMAPDRGQRFSIRLDREKMVEESGKARCEPPYLRVSAPCALLALLAVGPVSWNIADAALFLDYVRAPNRYDPKLHSFLNYLTI